MAVSCVGVLRCARAREREREREREKGGFTWNLVEMVMGFVRFCESSEQSFSGVFVC